LCAAYYLAFLIRFEGVPPREQWNVLWGSLAGVVALKVLLLAALKVPQLTWRYISLIEAQRIAGALALASGLLAALCLGSAALGSGPAGALWGKVPVGVLVIDFALGLLGLLGLRVSARMWNERHERATTPAPRAVIQVP